MAIFQIIVVLVFCLGIADVALFVVPGILSFGLIPGIGSGETALSNCLITVTNGYFARVYPSSNLGNPEVGQLSTGTSVYSRRKVTSPFVYYYVDSQGQSGWLSGKASICVGSGVECR